jgi:GH24 family phage-related lysozyme (muramidase)
MKASRISVAALVLSAAGIVGIATQEGYVDVAMVPTKGDRPTVGFGMTERPDGSPVQMGDRTTPVAALQRTLAYTHRADAQIKKCLTAPLHQAEYDLMHDFGYQYGLRTLCQSSIVAKANAGDYAGSCEAYLAYRFAAKYDCSTLVGGKPNKRCWGVWARQLDRHSTCMAAQ